MRKEKGPGGLIIILLISVFILSLSGCGADGNVIDYSDNPVNMETNEDAIENFTVAVDFEATSINPAFVSYIQEQELITNIYDALTAFDKNGELIPSVAESWEHSDDYRTWTFHLRDDNYWVNYKGEIQGTVTAQDFITGLEFSLNYAKSEGISAYVLTEVVEGAAEYLEYTMSLSEDEARKLTEEDFADMVGVSAPDDTTLIVKTQDACTFLPSVAASCSFVPASAEHINEVGLENYIIDDYTTAWFNGPYVMTQYIKNNVKVLDANPHWYGNDEHTRFMSVTYKYMEDSSMTYQLYENNELDEVYLSQAQTKRIIDNEDSKYYGKTTTRNSEGYAGFFIFNYFKTDDEDWNRAVSNTAFRKAFVFGYDNYNLCKLINRANPDAINLITLQPYGAGALSDGTLYKDLVKSLLNVEEAKEGTYVRNSELFAKYKKQAMEELTAQGVSFPVNADYYVLASSSAAISRARVIKETMENSLGKDFIKFNIRTYSSSYNVEVIDAGVASIIDAGYAFDYRDPSNILSLFKYDNESSYTSSYSKSYLMADSENVTGNNSYRSELLSLMNEYNERFDAANKITDNDERMLAFARLEKFAIEEGAFAVPAFNERKEMLTNIDEDSLSVSSISGYDNRYVDIKTHKQK